MPCFGCRGDATTDPCDPCPLYGAWLERHGLPDEEAWRETYAGWVGAGGWVALWAANAERVRAMARTKVASVLARYPAVRDRYPNYPNW